VLNESGSEPVSEFAQAFKTTKLTRELNSIGIVPRRLLVSRNKLFNDDSLPRDNGIVPVKQFVPKLSHCIFVKEEYEAGMVPRKLFTPKFKNVSETIALYELGRVPVKRLLCNSK
jgi:hypothetical protein